MITSTAEQPASERGPRPRLHRSTRESLICGVCGGIAEYLAVDPSLVRLAFIVATVCGGFGVVPYVVLAIILPAEDSAPAATSPFSPERSRMIAGLVLIALGGLLLGGNMGLAPWLSWTLFWPAMLILIGAGLLVRNPHSATSA